MTTDQHRATSEQWDLIAACLLELRARVEALEAGQQQPHQDKLDRLIALDRDDDTPTPEADSVASDEGLQRCYAQAVTDAIQRGASNDELSRAGRRACYNLGRQHGAAQPPAAEPAPPVALHDALIKAECALSDIVEGEETNDAPNTFEWAEQRCAETLSIIRPVMQQHGIRTSECPPAAQPGPPAAPAGGLVERVAMAADCYPHENARAAIREVAAALIDWHDSDQLIRTAWEAGKWLEQQADR